MTSINTPVTIQWHPLILILIFAVIIFIFFIWGKIFFRSDYNEKTDQIKPFNSGHTEEINTNIPSSNLYWGFKRALDFYYKKIINLHNGDLNDYLKWLIITIAICFLLISGGIL
jgi:hypothetical protein